MAPLVCTMWDDGLRTDLPLIEKLNDMGVQASFALSPGRYRKTVQPNDPRGDYGELITQADYHHYRAHDIVAHGFTHAELPTLPIAAARQELRIAKDVLEIVFQRPVTGCCYPYGKSNKAVREAAAEYYVAARSTLPRKYLQTVIWADRYNITPTAHWAEPNLVPIILASGLSRVLIWGHTYEFAQYPEGEHRAVSIYRDLLTAGARFCSFEEIVNE